MRLQELYIKDYKVLQDFTLRFDAGSAVSVLIGENGAGKTTVVECLTIIFAEFYKLQMTGKTTLSDLFAVQFPFSFRLNYILSTGGQVGFDYEHEIRDTVPYAYEGELFVRFDYTDRLSIQVGTNELHLHDSPEAITTLLQEEGFSSDPISYLLPSTLVLYYSGIGTTIEKIVNDYQSKLITATLTEQKKAELSIFYFRPENFPALLIGLLSFEFGDIPDQLEAIYRIPRSKPFETIRIQVKRPTWAKKGQKATSFWGATGDIANFLAVLRDRTETVFNEDQITFTIRTRNQLSEVWGFYGSEKSLFEYLVMLQADGLIQQIDVDLHKEENTIVPHQRLSEGEKQRLIITALQELLAAGENSLFLLDEPDTYLHPEWKRNFITHFQFEKAVADNFLGYYLITTHSAGIVSGMRKSQLHILRKEDSRSMPKTFAFDPYGKPEDDILFDFFGISGLRYKPVEEKLNELSRLINEGQHESDDFQKQFAELEQAIGKDDLGLARLTLEIARRKRAAQAE
ncbi:MAG: hypothetical protein EAZ91_19985 [Cytophagales bacterium]|nr:MAG: hypothetical protein EAZ91_19985 [Cytophagales bacterium]